MIVSTYIIEYFCGDGGLVFWTAHILPQVSPYNWSKLYYFTSTGRQIGRDAMSPNVSLSSLQNYLVTQVIFGLRSADKGNLLTCFSTMYGSNLIEPTSVFKDIA